MGGVIEQLLVQIGFGIALAQLAEQDLPDLRDQPRIGVDAPSRVFRQVFSVKLPQSGAQGLPEARAGRLDFAEGFHQQTGVGFCRTRHHQVGLELVVGSTGAFGALGIVRGQLDQGRELLA